jgi:hypothetical protein
MPGMSGLELLPKVGFTAGRPVILITAYGDAETKRKALEQVPRALLDAIALLRAETTTKAHIPAMCFRIVDRGQHLDTRSLAPCLPLGSPRPLCFACDRGKLFDPFNIDDERDAAVANYGRLNVAARTNRASPKNFASDTRASCRKEKRAIGKAEHFDTFVNQLAIPFPRLYLAITLVYLQ